MNKLKNKICSLYFTLKKSMEKFPVTIVTIIILTLIYVIDSEKNVIKTNILKNIMFFGFVFANGTFLTETISKEKIEKISKYIISAVIALISTYIFAKPEVIEKIISRNILDWIGSLFICSMISVFVLSVYYNYKKTTKTFEQYITSVFVNIFKTSIIYVILAVGSTIVTAIFIYLILDGRSYTLLLRIEILIFGIYYIPALLYCLYNIEEKTSKFSKIVIKYILETLVIAAFIIIYMYIIKIIVFKDMPSNQIFRILAALFILSCPIWTMVCNFKEDTIIDKINKLLPKLFIPFIILQIYSIGVRILENGITENRYLCIMLIIFEIIYTIIYLRKRDKIGEIILVFIALTIISTIVPYINMYNVSRISQYNNLKLFKEKTEYSEEEKKKIYGAYCYLQKTDQGNKLIETILTENEEEKLKSLGNSYKFENNKVMQYTYAYCNVNYIDVAEYKNLYTINSSNYSKELGNIEEVFGNFALNFENSNDIIYTNISEKIKEYIQYEYKLGDIFKKINVIQIDDSKTLILSSISISYNKVDKKVEDYSISGYLLVK